jgi:uncharacterized DUF497 family protein
MDSEWDEAKRQANTLKHGVDFVDAIEMFAGRFIETEDRRRDYGERGTKRLANWMAGLRKSFTWRDDRRRIISARRARRNERRAYYAGLAEAGAENEE